MIIGDITFFKDYKFPEPPFQTIVKPSRKTITFLTLLLKDSYFQSKVIDLRKKKWYTYTRA